MVAEHPMNARRPMRFGLLPAEVAAPVFISCLRLENSRDPSMRLLIDRQYYAPARSLR
jgi:hypothetical protein